MATSESLIGIAAKGGGVIHVYGTNVTDVSKCSFPVARAFDHAVLTWLAKNKRDLFSEVTDEELAKIEKVLGEVAE